MIGGLLLFVHSHGVHPAVQTVEFHHALLGSMGVGAALTQAVAIGMANSSSRSVRGWELVWAGLILLMGLQLLVYFE